MAGKWEQSFLWVTVAVTLGHFTAAISYLQGTPLITILVFNEVRNTTGTLSGLQIRKCFAFSVTVKMRTHAYTL